MVRHCSVFLTVVLLFASTTTGCRVAPPTADAWLKVGFRTPRQTFGTFQTALRADLPDLEYRTLAQELKSSEGLNQLAYRTFREELFDENPWLRYAACAEVVQESSTGPDRHTLVATVTKFFVEKTFAVHLVREDFYELYAKGALLEDGFANFERSLDGSGGDQLDLHLPLPFGTEPRDLSEARLGREWKITGFEEVPCTEERSTEP